MNSYSTFNVDPQINLQIQAKPGIIYYFEKKRE